MKAIFLDIDGVLNWDTCKARCNGYIGISDKKVKLLRKIVEATDAKIILSSTWRYGWSRTDHEYHDEMGEYLARKLKRERLYVTDKTDYLRDNRGREIRSYLNKHPKITEWVVLDDEVFDDFREEGIMNHLVLTSFYEDDGGLQEEHVERAIEILGEDR